MQRVNNSEWHKDQKNKTIIEMITSILILLLLELPMILCQTWHNSGKYFVLNEMFWLYDKYISSINDKQ